MSNISNNVTELFGSEYPNDTTLGDQLWEINILRPLRQFH